MNNKWYQIKEDGYPPEADKYLVVIKSSFEGDDIYTFVRDMLIVYYKGGNHTYTDMSVWELPSVYRLKGIINKVTHWQYLPDLPKEFIEV